GYRGQKNLPHGGDQPLAACAREAPGARARMDASPEQAFVRVDVSDPDHDARVHQQLLDADVAAARGPIEEFGREMLAERLDPEPREQGMTERVAVVPQHHAEASRIAQAQHGAVEVLVL